MSLMLGFSPLGMSADQKPRFYPSKDPSIYAGWSASKPQTLDSSLYASGSTPPPIALGGAPELFAPLDLYVTCDTALGTALGQARLNISYDGGVTVAMALVPTAASIALVGAGATGRTLACPVGPYSANNIWESRITAAASLKSATAPLTAANAACPRLKVGAQGLLGQPAWLFDGVANTLLNATVTNPITTTAQFVAGVVLFVTVAPATSQYVYSNGQNAGTGQTPWIYSKNNLTLAGNASSEQTVTSTGLAGKAYRFVFYNKGDATSTLWWGALTKTANFGASAARTGCAIASRGAAATSFASVLCAELWLGLGNPATNGFLANYNAYCASAFGPSTVTNN